VNPRADHIELCRNGGRYLGIIEAAYLAETLGTPLAYYTRDDQNRWKLRKIAHPKYSSIDLRDDLDSRPIAHLLFQNGASRASDHYDLWFPDK
jgi:hypothetical protein